MNDTAVTRERVAAAVAVAADVPSTATREVSTAFDETNLVPNAGQLPAALLAQPVDLAGLVEPRLGLTRHGVNSGAKALSGSARC